MRACTTVIALILLMALPEEAFARTGRRFGVAAPGTRGSFSYSDYLSVRRRYRRMYKVSLRKDGAIRFKADEFYVYVYADGSVRFRDRRARWDARAFALVFDITDAVMRGLKDDPYRNEKLAFLKTTWTWRRKLRAKWREAQWARYFAELPARLKALWGDRKRTAVQKRQTLYQLWLECLEPGRTRRSRYAQRARARIIAFIQRHLPAGSPQAFTPQELRTIAARRRGKTPFTPYGKSTLPPPAPRR